MDVGMDFATSMSELSELGLAQTQLGTPVAHGPPGGQVAVGRAARDLAAVHDLGDGQPLGTGPRLTLDDPERHALVMSETSDTHPVNLSPVRRNATVGHDGAAAT